MGTFAKDVAVLLEAGPVATGVAAGASAGAAAAATSGVIASSAGTGSFSWRNVLAGAVTGAITGGIAGRFGSVSGALSAPTPDYLKAAGLAFANAGAGYVGQKIAGVDVSFSWKSIAASAVGNLVSARVGNAVASSVDLSNPAISGIADGVIGAASSYATRSAFGFDEHWDSRQVLMDAFQNVISNLIASAKSDAPEPVGKKRRADLTLVEIEPAAIDLDLSDVELLPPGPLRVDDAPRVNLQAAMDHYASVGLDENGNRPNAPLDKYGNVIYTDAQIDMLAYVAHVSRESGYLYREALEVPSNFMSDAERKNWREKFYRVDALAQEFDRHDHTILHPHSADPATREQAILASTAGAVAAVVDFGQESIASTVTMVRNFTGAAFVQTGLADRYGWESAYTFGDQLGASVAGLLKWGEAPISNTLGSFSDRYAAADLAGAGDDVMAYFYGSRMRTSTTLDAASLATGLGGIALKGGRAIFGGISRIDATPGPMLGSRAAQYGVVGDLRRLDVANGSASYFDDLATQATRNPDSSRVVLGKFLEDGKSYTKVASHYDATYFKLKNWRDLSKSLTPEDMWRVNESFIDQQVMAGKEILLSHNPAKATGFYKREISYLSELGYKFVKDGWVWRAVR